MTFGAPALYAPDPPKAAPGTDVTLKGANLGASPAGSQLTPNSEPIPFTQWSDSAILFKVPSTDPAASAAWAPPTKVQLATVVNGQTSDSVAFTVT